MKITTTQERECLREAFRPDSVCLLFVGESPPASGRFFYSANSGLYRAMRAAFHTADETIGEENFLTVFRSLGCYLTDLSHEPIDHLAAHRRRAMRKNGEKRLAQDIASWQPSIIAPVLHSIANNVQRAAAVAGWQGQMLQLPYPGRWSQHRQIFIKLLVPFVQRLLSAAHRPDSLES